MGQCPKDKFLEGLKQDEELLQSFADHIPEAGQKVEPELKEYICVSCGEVDPSFVVECKKCRDKEIDRLNAELAVLKDECTCEECEQSLEDKETGVTAICIACWNAMVIKLRKEIDRLTAENKQLKDDMETGCDHTIDSVVDEDGCCISCGEDLNYIAGQQEEIERLITENKIKTEAVKEALSICKGLWAGVGNHPLSRYVKDVEYFEQVLKGVKDGEVQSKGV